MGRANVILCATLLLLAVVEPKSIGREQRNYDKGAFERIEEANGIVPEAMEADIMLNQQQFKFMSDYIKKQRGNRRERREALTNTFQKWDNARMPYVIDDSIDVQGRQAIMDSIAVYEAQTCIKVVPKEEADTNYVVFKKLGGCYSYVGKIGGSQDISIGEGCQYIPVVLHEIMHALGFFHEQSRLDRDEHVEIVRDNINPDFLDQFEKHPQGIADNLGSPYDYTGIMHYGNTAFAVDRSKPTLISRRNPGERLGGSQTLTDIDVAQLNTYYNCPASTQAPTTTKATTTEESTTKEAATTKSTTTEGVTTKETTTTETATTTEATTTSKATTPTEATTTAEATTTTVATTKTEPTTTKATTTTEGTTPTEVATTTTEATTQQPTTKETTTTEKPTTTQEPSTAKPTTEKPTTEGPTTEGPTTEGPTTQEPETEAPTTMGPTDEPTTLEPETEGPTTQEPTEEPMTEGPTTTTAPVCHDHPHVCRTFQKFASLVCPRFSFFRQNCPVMCDTCEESNNKKRCSKFKDRKGFFHRRICKFRASRGYCTSSYYQSWMINNCAKSCCNAGNLFD